MSRVKRILQELCKIAIMTFISYTILISILAYKDWRGCVCSVLSSTEQTFPIDERLYRVYEQDAIRSGTFAIVRTKCDHGKRIVLTVQPDMEIYSGYVINKN